MKGSELFKIIIFSLMVSVMLAIWVGIEEIFLAIVTFLIVLCIGFLTWK